MTDDEPRDYWLYLRKSKGRKGISRQRAITTAHVEREGGRIVGESADTDRTAFQKVGGAAPVRDGFTAMLAMLEATPGLGVAAWHADRLTRNSDDTEALIRVCAKGGHLVETPGGGTYDLSKANGRKRLRDDATDAAYEVDHAIERITAQKNEAAADGQWLGGRRPFGFEANGVTLRPEEAAAIAQGHHEFLAGVTLAAIARSWNDLKLTTSAGKPWDARAVGRVLGRARNAGLLEHNGSIAGPARWAAIVPESTWRATVAILADPERRTSPGPARKHLLTHIATCGVCGAPVFCTSTSSPAAGRRQVYRCRKDTRGHVARDRETLDQYVTGLVIARFSRADARKMLRPPQGRDVMLELQREKIAITELMAADRRMFLARVLTEQEFTDGRRKHQDDLAEIETRLAEASRQDVIAPLIGDPEGVWLGMSLDQRRAVIKAMMTIRVMPARKGRPAGWKPGQPYFDKSFLEIAWLR